MDQDELNRIQARLEAAAQLGALDREQKRGLAMREVLEEIERKVAQGQRERTRAEAEARAALAELEAKHKAAAEPEPEPTPEPEPAPEPEPEPPPDPRPYIQLFDPDAAKARLERAERQEREIKVKLKSIFEHIGEPMRPLAIVPDDIDESLAELRARMPNFGPVLDVVEEAVALALIGDRVLKLPPLLLAGDPGIGKTYFARALARIFDTGFHDIGLGSTTAGWVLTGMDLSWSSGRPGMVFEALRTDPQANPIILLDEIDKASTDARYNVLAGLLPLLEPHSARVFRDEAVSLPVDAGHICWVATANYPERLDAPLQSRFTEIAVRSPTRDECAVVAQSVWTDLVDATPWGQRFAPELPPDVVEVMSSVAPRAMRKALVRAAARAAQSGVLRLRPEHLPKPHGPSARMGFV